MSGLPTGWVEAPLGALCNSVTKHDPRERPDQHFTYIDIGGIASNRIAEVKSLTGEEAPSRARQIVKAGDTVLSTVRTYLRKTAIVTSEFDGATASTGFCVIRPAAEIEPRFLFYRVIEQSFVTKLSARQSGSSYPAVRESDVFAQAVWLPPLNEQRRIVAAIEEHLSRLDAADGSLRSGEQRAASLRARVLDGMSPQEATRVRIGDLVASGRRIAYGVLQPGPHMGEGVPLVRVGDVRNGRVDTGELKRISPSKAAAYPRTTLEGGEVILTLVGTIGRAAVVPPSLKGANVARAVGVIPLGDGVSPEYVALALSAPSSTARLGELAHEVARKTLNLEDVRSFDIALPPLDEQRRIVTRIEEQLSAIDALRAAIERAQRRSASLRRAVLERAFRGELVPQDPSDEPAELLLARISAERAAR